MGQRIFWENENPLAGQKILHLLLNPMIIHGSHNALLAEPVFSQYNTFFTYLTNSMEQRPY
jgi:hypothetical protein